MTKRGNHYEAAFEQYLRDREIPYVAVDEAKRSLFSGASIKNLDFIISAATGTRMLVDIKGRLFPSGGQKRYWTNWSTADDLESLGRWEQLFGGQFESMLVFAYRVTGDRAPVPNESLYQFRGETYGFVGIRLSDYAPRARQISPKWNTLAMPTRLFRQYAQPVDRFLDASPASNPPAAPLLDPNWLPAADTMLGSSFAAAHE